MSECIWIPMDRTEIEKLSFQYFNGYDRITCSVFHVY
jgi:hypothetical protein